MITLLKKELRQLLPISCLVFFLMGGGLLVEPMTERPDEMSWEGISSCLSPNNGAETAIVLLLICLAVGFSLFPREHDEKTIDFLHSLPLSRRTIFLTKVLAGYLVLVAGILLEQLVNWLLQLPNTQSMTGEQFSFRTAVYFSFLECSFCYIVLSHAVLLSFFRRFGLLIYGIFIWLVLALQNAHPGFLFLDFTTLLNLEYKGSNLLIPWHGLAFHCMFALLCLAVAAVLWLSPAERFTSIYQRLFRMRTGKVILTATSVGIAIVVIALMTYLSNDNADNADGRAVYVSFSTANLSTSHYRFTYPTSLRARVHSLAKQADDMYQNAATALNAEMRDRIIVDLTEQSKEHAGIAGWKKIRMDITSTDDSTALSRILNHETVHVLSAHLSEHRLAEHRDDTRFFTEGLAEYLSYKAVPDPGTLGHRRLIASMAWKRQQMSFEELVDDDQFAAKYDPDLVYFLGEVWAHALAQTCGEQAAGNLLRKMARKDAPKDLRGIVFWQEATQAVQCELSSVNNAWLHMLDELAKKNEEQINGFLRVKGTTRSTDQGDTAIVVRVDPPLALGQTATVLLRVRADANVERAHYYTNSTFLLGLEDNAVDNPETITEIRIPSSVLTGRRFDYQLGIETQPIDIPYFEPWKSAAVPK